MSANKKIITAAGGIVLNPENELLFIYRRGKWDLPKGKLDEGETIPECAVREVEEETGIRNILLGNFIGITKHEYFDEWVKADVLKETHWYEMKIETNQTLIPQTEEDIEDIKWIPLPQLQPYLDDSYPSIVEIIQLWKQNV